MQDLEDAVPYSLRMVSQARGASDHKLTCSGDVDMKTGLPSSILRKAGTRWFRNVVYGAP
jgi:hypothetical protein